MESPSADSVKDIGSQLSKESKLFDDRSPRNGSVSAEVLRLQNAIRVKDKELEDARKEVMTLKASLSMKDRALSQSEHELRLLKERSFATEGEIANMAKELAAMKVEKRKLEAQLANLAKKGDKEQTPVMLQAQEQRSISLMAVNSGEGGAFGSFPSADHVAALHADLRVAKQDGEKAAESVKVLENILRAKDKQINSLQRKLEEVELYKAKCADLENKVSDLNRQLESERGAVRTSADVLRSRDAEKMRLLADLAKTRAALESAQEAAARTSAALKASEARCGALEQEVGTLVGQLARTSAVAQRVAVSEVKAGCKDEGVIHVTRHLEEIRFMSGEVVRLQDRIAALEKELAVSEELKDQYRRRSQPGNSPGSSPCSSPSGAAVAASILGRTILRNGSRAGAARPLSAPRRPASAVSASSPAAAVRAAAAGRPSSVPRPRSAGVRASTNSTSASIAGASTTAAVSGSQSPRSSVRAGAAAAAGGAIRSSFSSASRRPQSARKLPWNSNAKSPAKLAAAAAAESAAAQPRLSGAKTRPSGMAAALQTPEGGETPAGEVAPAADGGAAAAGVESKEAEHQGVDS